MIMLEKFLYRAARIVAAIVGFGSWACGGVAVICRRDFSCGGGEKYAGRISPTTYVLH
jgi:hypothetical protein